MTVTQNYARLHLAFQAVARELGLTLTDVRVLVAIAERGGQATTRQLVDDILGRGLPSLDATASNVRRTLRALRDKGHAIQTEVAGLMRTHALTATGSEVAARTIALAKAGTAAYSGAAKDRFRREVARAITDADVTAIRRDKKATGQQLADRYGVTDSYINMIRAGTRKART